MGAAGLLDHALIRGQRVPGYYREDFAEEGTGEEAVAGALLTFDCRAEDLPELFENDDITIEGYGDRRFLRRERNGPDRVILVLGTRL